MQSFLSFSGTVLQVDFMSTQTQESKVIKVPLSDVHVWTPSGEEVWTGNVYALKAQKDRKTVTSYSQPHAVDYAGQLGGLVPSSGLWYQARKRLQKENPDVEKDFVTGVLEDTSTLWKYLKIGQKFADGLLIQYPFANEDGSDFVRDEKGIPKGRQIWQMTLPVGDFYINKMPQELATFANTLYGTEDAIGKLPDYAYFWANAGSIKPGVERRAFRGCWDWSGRAYGRVSVLGLWAPSNRFSDVGFRVFEGGDSIKDVDARKRRLIVEAGSMAEAERYASALRESNVPFVEE
jgi:hypothetical protein